MRGWTAALIVAALAGCPSDANEKKTPARAKPNPAGASPISAGNRIKLKAGLAAVLNAAKQYKAVQGKAPRDVQALLKEELLTPAQAKDLWGNPYRIEAAGPKLRVVTFGADGKQGGQGADKDWSSDDL